jgi:putative oxidoreductase
MSVGLLILRLVVGLLLIGHGTQKLFGWFGGYGLEGTGQFFASLGYPPGKAMPFLAGAAEAGGGLLFAMGLFTPLAAAAIMGVMLNAILTAHRGKGLWVTNGGSEYPIVLFTVALTTAFAGPGRYSLDYAYGWRTGGWKYALTALALALAAATVTLVLTRIPARRRAAIADRDRRVA